MEASDLRATIERLRELEAKATKGEWFAYAGYVCVTEEHRDATGIPIPEPSNFGQWEGSTGDEALIIAARNALPFLLRLASERLDAMESEPLERARARAEAFEEAARECGQRSAEWHSVGCNDSRDEAYCCEHVIRALAAKERAQQNTVSPTFGEANTQQEKS